MALRFWIADRNPHQILAPDDVALEDFRHLRDQAFPNARHVHLVGNVAHDQSAGFRVRRDLCRFQARPASRGSGTVGSPRRLPRACGESRIGFRVTLTTQARLRISGRRPENLDSRPRKRAFRAPAHRCPGKVGGETSRGRRETVRTTKFEITNRGNKGRQIIKRGHLAKVIISPIERRLNGTK